MKHQMQFFMFFVVLALTACSKEEEPKTAPAPAPESQILKPQIQTLHKAEDLQQQSVDAIAEQRKQIEEQTQ